MRLSLTTAPLVVAAAALLISPGTALASAGSAAGPASHTRTMAYGSRGSDVRRLQHRLAELHYYPGPANGTFGSDTQEAVWAFQEVQGLPVTGSAGSATQRALRHPKAPRVLVRRGGATRVEVNLGRHYLVVYHHNHVVLVSHVSTGGGYYYCSRSCGYAITPTGNFRTTTFMPGWVRVPLGEMYNPVFFIGTAFAIHGDTYVPLAPASHGCVRIPMDVAAFFHRLVSSHGTPVYIRR